MGTKSTARFPLFLSTFFLFSKHMSPYSSRCLGWAAMFFLTINKGEETLFLKEFACFLEGNVDVVLACKDVFYVEFQFLEVLAQLSHIGSCAG